MSKKSGLTLETQKRRIVKRTPRPHVSVVQQPADSPAFIEEQVTPRTTPEPVVNQEMTPEPIASSEVTSQIDKETESVAKEMLVAQVQTVKEPETKKASQKKKAVKKKEDKKHWKEGTSGGHRLKRYEGRLHGGHADVMEYLHDKGARQTHKLNREIKKPEMLAGLIELIRPFHKKVSFKNTAFERGQMYGEGAEKMRDEVGRSFKRAAYKYVLTQLGQGSDSVLESVIEEMTDSERQELITQLALMGASTRDADEAEEQSTPIAVNE